MVTKIRYIQIDDAMNFPKFLCEDGCWVEISDLIQHIAKPHTGTYELKQFCADWAEDMEAEGDSKIKPFFFLLTSKLSESDPLWKEAFDYVFEKGDWL